jgi:hypothetical protein
MKKVRKSTFQKLGSVLSLEKLGQTVFAVIVTKTPLLMGFLVYELNCHIKKITVTSTKIDSSHESGKNFITWTWPASTTIIYNNHVSCKRKGDIFDVHPIESYISSQVSSVPVIAHTSFLPPSIV